MALLVAWSVTILRSLGLQQGTNCKFSQDEREVMLEFLKDLVLFSLIRHQQHRYSGVLVILATVFTVQAGYPEDDMVSRGELEAAVQAGQTHA